MRIQSISIVLSAVLFFNACGQRSNTQNQGQQGLKITFVKLEADQRVAVRLDGKLFTSSWWPDTGYKQIIYPFVTSSGYRQSGVRGHGVGRVGRS